MKHDLPELLEPMTRMLGGLLEKGRTGDGRKPSYLKGVGSFLLRTRRGLLTELTALLA